MSRSDAGHGEQYLWLQSLVGHKGEECIPWPHGGNWNGYGHLGINGKVYKAHRIMCELAHGNPPIKGLVAAHSCKDRSCVNPDHLSWKTPRQNLMDRHRDGTLTKKRWTKYGTLTDNELREICVLKDYLNQREIGVIFGISYQHVSVIQNGKLKRQQSMKKDKEDAER